MSFKVDYTSLRLNCLEITLSPEAVERFAIPKAQSLGELLPLKVNCRGSVEEQKEALLKRNPEVGYTTIAASPWDYGAWSDVFFIENEIDTYGLDKVSIVLPL